MAGRRSKRWGAGGGETAEQTGRGCATRVESLLGGKWVRRAGLGRGRAQGSGTGPWCFPLSAASHSGQTEIFPPCSVLSHGGSQKWLRGGDGSAGIPAPPWGEGQWVSQSVPGAGSAVPPLCRGPRPGGEREELLGGGGKPPPGSSSCLAWAGWSPSSLCAGEDRQTALGGCSVMELLAPPGACWCSTALCPGSCSGARFAARFLQRQSCALKTPSTPQQYGGLG